MMEGEEEEGEAAATDTSARSLAGAACGDMAVGKHTEVRDATRSHYISDHFYS